MAARADKDAEGADSLIHPRAETCLEGHSDAERVLLRAWDSGRLPHAWLLCGPRGIGKATLAYRFARFVLAGGGAGETDLLGGAPATLHMDPDHTVARQVAAGGHPDLLALQPGMAHPDNGRPSREILVGHVRRAVHFCFMTPASADWRVVILDPADALTPNAANALLKVLEEPPARALILLVSHAPGALLPTIRSRCAQLALAPLQRDSVAALLRKHLPDLADADVDALAGLAEGSLGRALELHGAGGLDLYRDLVSLLGDIPGIAPERLHAFGDRLGQGRDGESFRLCGELLGWWLGRLVRAGAQGRAPGEVVPGEQEVMARLLARADLERWIELWEKTVRLFARAERSHFDRKQVILTAFLEMETVAA